MHAATGKLVKELMTVQQGSNTVARTMGVKYKNGGVWKKL